MKTILGRSRRAMILCLVAAFFAPLMATAAPNDDLGLPIGTVAPPIDTPLDQASKPRGMPSLMGEKGLVFVFYRSADWCPYCKRQLDDINGGLAELEKRGYRVAALSYDKPEILAKFSAEHDIKFALLSDPERKVIERYYVRDTQYTDKSNYHYGVPRPIIFILDAKGVIKGKLFEETYKTRPPVAAVIAKIDELTAAK